MSAIDLGWVLLEHRAFAKSSLRRKFKLVTPFSYTCNVLDPSA